MVPPAGPRHAAPDDSAAEPRPTPWRPAPAPGASRRAARRRAERARRSASGRLRGRWLALVGALVAVAAVLVTTLVRGDAAPDGRDAPDAPDAPAAPVVPGALVDWLNTQVPEGATVAAAPKLQDGLLGAGVEPAVLPDRAAQATGDAAVPALVLRETAPEGGRVLARFEGERGGPLFLADPTPVEPTPDERRRRETLAAAVLANPTTRTGGNTRELLAGADVDARLLSLIGALTAREGVGLSAFPRLPGEEAGTAPARRVVVDALGASPLPDDGAATQRLVAWLDAQLPPFAPASVEVTAEGVLIAFSYVPGPDAVVSARTP